MKIKLPYGQSHLELTLDDKRIKGIVEPEFNNSHENEDKEDIIREALEQPIDSQRLCELARGKKKVLIVTSDHTRPVPSRLTMPLLLEEIRKYNPAVEIRILVATGSHRPSSPEELREKFGDRIFENEKISNHDSNNHAELVFMGKLPSGGELWLNSLVEWSDLIVAEGFIEPHFFAGFSGGRKSIMPGIASYETVLANHCAEFIASPYARTGNLADNPIHEDMVYAARKSGLAFILNVVIDADKRVLKAYAGNPASAHEAGCRFVNLQNRVKQIKSKIVITSNSGYPLDQNIYQAVKGMTAAEACVEDNGIIIIAAECIDGHGGEAFFRWFAEAGSANEVTRRILKTPRNKTLPDQWQAQILARVLEKAKVVVVADPAAADLINKMHMTYARTLEEGMAIADSITGKDSQITIIPDGVGVIIEPGF